MPIVLLTLLLLPSLLWAGAPVQVVYHIATKDAHQQHIALLNLENHLQDLGERQREAEIKVLLEGEGISLLVRAIEEPRLQQRVIALQRAGVTFLVGGDSIKQQGIDPQKDLFQSAVSTLVDNSMLTLVTLQQQGFAYIPYTTR